MKTILATFAITAAFAGSAVAADLPVKARPMAPAPVIATNWTGCYIGAGLGPGPRDGIMTGLAEHGLSVRLARTLIEVTVVISGFLLGGTVGVGTLVFALSIGPLAQVFLPLFRVSGPFPEAATRPVR